MYLVLSEFTSRPISLLASNRVSDVDVRIIRVEMNLKVLLLYLTCLGYGTVAGSREHSNEPTAFIKCGQFVTR
jgi:hypothetical protein